MRNLSWLLAAVVSLAATASAQPAVPTISLEETVRLARRDPAAVRQAHAALLAAEAHDAAARSRWLPAFALEAAGGYGYDNQILVPGVPRIEAHALTARAAASLEWTLLDWARGGHIDAAASAESAQRFAVAAQQDRTALLAVEVYLRAGAASALVSDAELTLARRSQQHAATLELVQAGTRSPVDAQRAQIERVSAEYMLAIRRTEEQAAFAALAAAVGRPAHEQLRPAQATAAWSGRPDTVASARKAALQGRPELQSAAATIASHRFAHEAAVGERLPTIGALATGSFQYIDVRDGVGLEGDQYGATAGLSLRWRGLDPAVWSKAGVAEAEAAVATRERDALQERIEAEAVQAFYALARAQTEFQRAAAVLEAAAVAREAQNGRYLAGISSMLELLDAEALEQSARVRRIEAARDEAIAQAQLMAACGRLSQLN